MTIAERCAAALALIAEIGIKEKRGLYLSLNANDKPRFHLIGPSAEVRAKLVEKYGKPKLEWRGKCVWAEFDPPEAFFTMGDWPVKVTIHEDEPVSP